MCQSLKLESDLKARPFEKNGKFVPLQKDSQNSIIQ